MDLFVINRYNVEEVRDDPKRESRILNKLKQNIEKKKKEQEKLKKDRKENEKNEEIKDENEDQIMEEIVSTKSDISQNVEDKTDMMVLDNNKISENFTILSDSIFTAKSKVKMNLASWLTYPTVISNDLSNGQSIDNLNYLEETIKANLKSINITNFFPVQTEVIPWLLESNTKPAPFRSRDICVSAPTGSGKTLAYVIPIIQLLLNRISCEVRALIVLPVKELADQVCSVFKQLCKNTKLSCILLSGKMSFGDEQKKLLYFVDGQFFSKVDIIIATAGQLVQHIKLTKGLNLNHLKYLIIDEADRIMDDYQNDWLYHLNKFINHDESNNITIFGKQKILNINELWMKTYKEPQKLLFSATLSHDPEKLQTLGLFKPKLFTAVVSGNRLNKDIVSDQFQNSNNVDDEMTEEFIGKYTKPSSLIEKYCITETQLKPLTLYTLINENNWNRFLIFVNSTEVAHRLSYVLQRLLDKKLIIEELSSALNSGARQTVLAKFTAGVVNGLISSDALARGIDIPDIDYIISYDVPRHLTTYIHRIGRTARAGKVGTAITLLTSTELKTFQENILACGGKASIGELQVKSNIEELNAKKYSNALKGLQDALLHEKQLKIQRIILQKVKGCDIKIKKQKTSLVNKIQLDLKNKKPEVILDKDKTCLPQSWLMENQVQIKQRRERKKLSKNKFNKKKAAMRLKLNK